MYLGSTVSRTDAEVLKYARAEVARILDSKGKKMAWINLQRSPNESIFSFMFSVGVAEINFLVTESDGTRLMSGRVYVLSTSRREGMFRSSVFWNAEFNDILYLEEFPLTFTELKMDHSNKLQGLASLRNEKFPRMGTDWGKSM